MNWILAGLLMSAPIVAVAMDGNMDESFFKHAAESGMAEVKAGQLAQDKASNQELKDFGAMMVKDHSAANNKLESIAAAQNIKLPKSPSTMQAASYKELQMHSGDSFDKAYVKSQIKGHEDAVALFQKEVSNGKNPQAKEFAAATLPTIQEHLSKIKQIAQAKGISS
jgi:putative membrane protein